ncbi:MAG: Glu/Leu/Phe/Val dehydrogenase [Sedimentisphaeraceae bacterium JB056]
MKTNGLLQTSISNFENSAKRLNLNSLIYDSLLYPKERIECTTVPILTNGKHCKIKTYLVRHNDALGPSKGGIRMLPDVTLDDITGLAMEMTWKTALIGVPFGGGKSGICCDSSDMTADDKEIVLRSFTRGVARHIGPEIYIPAPDMGTNETDMGHIKDCVAYSKATSITEGCYVTGKPVILGGIIGRRQATGSGVAYSVQAACDKLGIDMNGCRIVVQGFGNVGSVAASVLADHGAKIIAVSDISAAVFDPNGIDIESLLNYSDINGNIKGFDNAEIMDSRQMLELDCDVLIPAAAQSQINEVNADKIKAKIIAEGANAPTTPQGDEILNEKNVFIVPDILCNAGGVFVSYLEYAQETQREQMALEDVQQRLFNRMNQKFQQVFDYSVSQGITMRNAAMDIAIKTVAQGLTSRGFHP